MKGLTIWGPVTEKPKDTMRQRGARPPWLSGQISAGLLEVLLDSATARPDETPASAPRRAEGWDLREHDAQPLPRSVVAYWRDGTETAVPFRGQLFCYIRRIRPGQELSLDVADATNATVAPVECENGDFDLWVEAVPSSLRRIYSYRQR